MDKVVLLTDRLEECEPLISCLKLLFPGCEVQAQPKQAGELQRASLALEPSTAYRMDRDFAKNLRKIIAENSC
jgi:hypothetical protein